MTSAPCLIIGADRPSRQLFTLTPATRHEIATKLVDRFSLWGGVAGLIPVPVVDVVAVGGGRDAAIDRVQWRLKKIAGPVAYLWAGLGALFSHLPSVQVTGGPAPTGGQLVLLGNGRFYGGRFPVFPKAQLSDGKLDLAVLPNGNIVVVDSSWHAGRGAAWLYSPHGQLISGLKGSQSGDSVGSGGITIVGDDFVVASPQWRNGTKERAGAATWVDGQAGLDATVSTANSLVGDALGQQIGTSVVALGNGSYVVVSPAWQPSNIDDQFNNDQYGAVTWCGGSNGCRGFVTVQNSLVGSAYGHVAGCEIG